MSKSSQTVARQWQIAWFLADQSSYISSTQILEHLQSQGFNTDLRTVQRDLQSLKTRFDLDCNQNDRPYSWRWRRVANSTSHKLTYEQALCLNIIQTELCEHIPTHIQEELKPLFLRAKLMLSGGMLRQLMLPRISSPPSIFAKIFGKKKKSLLALIEILNTLNLTQMADTLADIDVDWFDIGRLRDICQAFIILKPMGNDL